MITANHSTNKRKSQGILYFLCLALATAMFFVILLLNININIKIVLTIFTGLSLLFTFKKELFLYFIFAITPSLRIISQKEEIYNQINFNVILHFSVIFFGLLLVIKNKNIIIEKIKKTPFILSFILFTLLASLSLFYTTDRLKSFEELIRLCSVLFLFLSTFILSQDKKTATRLLKAIIIGAIFPALVGIWQYFGNSGWYDISIYAHRIYGTLIHPATFSFFLLALIPINFTLLQNTKNHKTKFTYALIIALFLALIFFSLTRGAWIGLLAMLFIYGLFKNKKIIFASLAILFIIYLITPSINNRVNDIFNPKYNSSFITRINILKLTVPAFSKSPVFGNGYGNFEKVNLEYNPEAVHYESQAAHNDYLRVIIELGLAGLIIYLSIFIFIFKYFYSIYKNSNNQIIKNFAYSLIALWASIVIISLGDNIIRTIPLQYVVWGYTAIVLALSSNLQNKKEVTN